MSMKRRELARVVGDLVGTALTIEDPLRGWPALGQLRTDEGAIPVALFLAPIDSGHRPSRVEVERRFQNPASSRAERANLGWTGLPIEVPADTVPLLLGVWTTDRHLPVRRPVLVLADALKRAGLHTRYSVFQRVPLLLRAAERGWAEGLNQDGERMQYFEPRLLPAVALAQAEAVVLPAGVVDVAVEAAGLAESAETEAALEAAGERARRSVTRLVRDARFSGRVIAAYHGRCAMCGLGLSLVQGAHIYPASAPDSSDDVRNGLCLCSNHHDAFDRHLIWVDPDTRGIRLHPTVEAHAGEPAVGAFMASTAERLRDPQPVTARPLPEMFRRRYDYFQERYDWAG